jgi:hypothetical protein
MHINRPAIGFSPVSKPAVRFGRQATSEEIREIEKAKGRPEGFYTPGLCYIADTPKEKVLDQVAIALNMAAECFTAFGKTSWGWTNKPHRFSPITSEEFKTRQFGEHGIS